MGNRLFQFAAGVVIAEQLGRELVADGIDGFRLKFPEGGETCSGEPLTLQNFAAFVRHRRMISEKRLPVRLNGYFQEAAFLAPHLPSLGGRMECTSKPMMISGDDDLMINLRLGDYLIRGRHWRSLPNRYLDDFCRKRDWRNIHVVTDEPEHEIAQRLKRRYGAQVLHGSIGQDFETVRHATNIAISSSSFSWWAAMLSNARRIYFPQLANWSPWSVYEPGQVPPAERLFPADDSRVVAFPGTTLGQISEFVAFLCSLDPGYRTRYLTHWRWSLKRSLGSLVSSRDRSW